MNKKPREHLGEATKQRAFSTADSVPRCTSRAEKATGEEEGLIGELTCPSSREEICTPHII